MDIQPNLSPNDLSTRLKELGTGVRKIDDCLFEDTYKICNIIKRTGNTVEQQDELCRNVVEEFGCNIVGCREQFQTLLDYEIHYNGSHRYVCQNCKKILPTPRILDIHIQESHDSFFQVLAEKMPMYQCYVSECNLKFTNTEDRRLHCISMHKFPKKFRYDEFNHHKNKSKEDQMETDQPQKEQNANKNKKYSYVGKQKHQKGFAKVKDNSNEPINSNESNSLSSSSSSAVIKNKSSLIFLPRQVQQRSFNKMVTKNNKTQSILENNSIMEMAEVLPDITK